MSLNKFTDTQKGLDLDLGIGADEIEARQITTDNIDVTTINGLPYAPGGGVTNPLTSDLKLGGFAIIEPLSAVSPALNIDQLDPAKKIDLKIGGIPKVVVKNAEVELKTDLNLNQNNINNCLVVNNQAGQPLNLIGGSNVSAVILDASPTQGVIIGSNVGASTDITGDTSLSLRSNAGSIDLFPSSQMNVIVGGLPRLGVDASEVIVGNSLNMNTQDIINANVIVRPSNGNVIELDNDINPPLVTGALTIESGANKELLVSSGAGLALNSTSGTSYDTGGGDHLFSNTPDGTILTLGSQIDASKDLDMNGNQILNVPRVDSGLSNAVLNLVGRDRVDIGIGGGGRMEIEDTRVYINPFANFNLGDKIVWIRANEMPSGGVFQANTTYIFVGSRTTATSFTLPANCKIMGTGKNNSTINYTGAGSLFISNDNNLDISDITFTSSDNAGRILSAINLGQDKTLNLTRVQIRNAKNGMDIVGYDLVDLNNCLFTFFESGSATPIGVNFNDNSKVQLSSCEFLRWFQEGGTPATTAFTGNMLQFGGALNALNLNGSFFHPQYDQNGIDLSALTSVIEGTITSNTFIDINLNSPTFQVLVPPSPTLAASYVIESNSIYPNLKSQVTYVLSAVNTTATDLSVNNPNVINHNNLALPLAIQFATIGTNGLITYTKKRTANFMIVATCNIELVAGTNNRVGLGLFVNGAEVPLAYSYVNLSAAGTANQKPATLSFTGQANLNDTFQLSVFNTTAANNVIVNDVNFAGIEI